MYVVWPYVCNIGGDPGGGAGDESPWNVSREDLPIWNFKFCYFS